MVKLVATALMLCGVSSRIAFSQNARPGTTLYVGVGNASDGGGFIRGAEVVIAGLHLRVRTDSLGEARIQGIPPGRFIVEVRRLGDQPLASPVVISGEDSTDLIFMLMPSSQSLPTVVVSDTATSSPLREFEERYRRHVAGYFISPDQLRAANGADLPTMISAKIPGVIAHQDIDGTVKVYSLRGENTLGADGCQVSVFLDGIRINTGDAGVLPLALLGAVEYYPPEYTPVQYRVAAPLSGERPNANPRAGTAPPAAAGGSAACGVLLLWSKP